MIRNPFFVIAILLLAGCNQNREQTTESESDMQYDFYCNDRYDYCIDYPVFLIPQGEADNSDGQQFLSADGKIVMSVYHAIEIDIETGDFLSLKQAYNSDLEELQPSQHIIDEMYYMVSGEVETQQYVYYRTLAKEFGFINIRFKFPKEENLDAVIKHVSESLHIGYNEFETEQEFVAFLNSFLKNVWWNKEFNIILQSEALYYQPISIKRIYSPGTVALLAGKEENYGLTEYDSGSVIEIPEDSVFLPLPDDISLCDLEDEATVYYVMNADLPEYVVNSETFEVATVDNDLGDTPVAAVYLTRKDHSPRIFYFLATVDGWKLAIIDDSQCEA